MNVNERNGVVKRPRLYGRDRPAYSRWRGVTFHKRKRRWYAYMDATDADGNRRRKHLGCYPPTRAGELEAARWRDEMLTRYGIFTGLNFPLT
jgi:hypothetical protein